MKIFKAIGLTILIFFLSLMFIPLFSNLGIQVSNDTLIVALIVFLIFTVIVCTMMILEELRSMQTRGNDNE